MARYIDADALTAEFKRLTLGENSLIERMFADGVYAVIETFPTADVAPRAEAAREIFEELDKKIFNHIPDLHTIEIYTELKKKYTEPEPPKGD